MEKKIKFKLPMLPNFVMAEGNSQYSTDIKDFTDEELKQIGKEWTEALLAHAQKRRKLFK